jgi:phosphatidylglycerophosphatase C
MSIHSTVSRPVIAAFDFDGTLTYHYTLVPFLTYVSGRFKVYSNILLLAPLFISCLMGLYSRQKAKEALLKRVIGGMPVQALKKKGVEFISGPLQTMLRPEAMQKLRWHQEQGHRCILISANLNVYLETWCALVGIDDLICSKLKVNPEGIVTGALEGENCWGSIKVERLLQLLGPKKQFVLFAYGDSQGDKELLAIADHPFYRTTG